MVRFSSSGTNDGYFSISNDIIFEMTTLETFLLLIFFCISFIELLNVFLSTWFFSLLIIIFSLEGNSFLIRESIKEQLWSIIS